MTNVAADGGEPPQNAEFYRHPGTVVARARARVEERPAQEERRPSE